MIEKKHIILLFVASIISIGIWIRTPVENPDKRFSYSTRVFEGSAGWGYDILVNNSVLIHQEYIPVIPGKRAFSSKEHATKAANLVLQKLQHNQLPTLTTFDLEQIFHPDKTK